MSREEISTLLQKIKVFYPRFEAVKSANEKLLVNSVTVDAWFDAIGYMPLTEALAVLDRHMESEQGGRLPTISTFKSRGRPTSNYHCTATLEAGRVRWEPEEGKIFEIPVTWDKSGAWKDEEGRLWAEPETI